MTTERPSEHRHGRDRPSERRGLIVTLGLTATIMVAEFVGGWLSNSLALLSDAGHMLTDVLAIGLSWAALGFAAKPPTDRKTYGWYRLEILAALLNGVTLVVISIVIFREAYERMLDPPEIATGTLLIVASIGLAANAVGLLFLSGHRHSLNVRGAYLHVMGDLLSSIGVLAGGVIIRFTGKAVVDPVISFVIGAVIVVGAVRLVKESVDVLLEATPAGMDLDEIGRVLAEIDGVQGVHHVHVWSLTSGVHALSCHAQVRRDELPRSDAILASIHACLRSRFGIGHATVQIESDERARDGSGSCLGTETCVGSGSSTSSSTNGRSGPDPRAAVTRR
jgi:cobalt-zinc-cadmium efflux system protein